MGCPRVFLWSTTTALSTYNSSGGFITITGSWFHNISIVFLTIAMFNSLTLQPLLPCLLVFSSSHLHSDSSLFCLVRLFSLKLYRPLLDSFLQGLNNCWQHRKVKTFIEVNHPVIFRPSNLKAPGHITLAQPSISGTHVVQSMKAKSTVAVVSVT